MSTKTSSGRVAIPNAATPDGSAVGEKLLFEDVLSTDELGVDGKLGTEPSALKWSYSVTESQMPVIHRAVTKIYEIISLITLFILFLRRKMSLRCSYPFVLLPIFPVLKLILDQNLFDFADYHIMKVVIVPF